MRQNRWRHHNSFIFKLRRTPWQEKFSRLATFCELITLLRLRGARVRTREAIQLTTAVWTWRFGNESLIE